MTAQATQRRFDLSHVGRIHHVGDRMIVHRVTEAVAEGQDRDLIDLVIILGQLDLAAEDGQNVLGFEPLRDRIGTMTFQAKGVAFGA